MASSADRYEVIEQLGVGGSGRVWRARDTTLQREVALKEIPAGPGAMKEARRCGPACASVCHYHSRRHRGRGSCPHRHGAAGWPDVGRGDPRRRSTAARHGTGGNDPSRRRAGLPRTVRGSFMVTSSRRTSSGWNRGGSWSRISASRRTPTPSRPERSRASVRRPT